MRNQSEMRLECLRLATSLGVSKNLPPKDVVPYAMEFFRFIDGDPTEKADTSKLAERFGRK